MKGLSFWAALVIANIWFAKGKNSIGLIWTALAVVVLVTDALWR